MRNIVAVLLLGFAWGTATAATLAVEPFDQERALAEVRAKIAGRETERAGAVFENLEILAEFPAGKLPGIMEIGFARSLGVNCTHCHDPAHWDADEKDAKRIARAMWALVTDTNARLREIAELKERKPQPTVNCTTCHRGQKKPALMLPPAGDSRPPPDGQR